MPDTITVIRESERPEVAFVGAPGAATYRTIIGDDTGEGLPIRTGIQTSQPGYQTRVHSHPYVETLTVISGRGEAWLVDEPGSEPGPHRARTRSHGRLAGEPSARLSGDRRRAAGDARHPHLRQSASSITRMTSPAEATPRRGKPLP